MRAGLLPVLTVLIAAGLTGAAQAACKPPEAPPVVTVNLMANPPGIDQSRVRQELKQFDISTVSPYGMGQNVHVNGLMRGSISVQTQSAIAWQRDADGGDNCFWFDHVTINLLLSPTIYIAREIPSNTCVYREVLAHEYRHYNTDVQIAKDYQATLRAEITNFVNQVGVIGPFPVQLQEAPKAELSRRLETTINAINDRMKFERVRRQALLDTREEYERVATTCPAERHLM